MQLQTILQILYANKHEDVISLATRIDNNIPFDYKIGDKVVIELHKDVLPTGYEFAASSGRHGNNYGYVEVEIIAHNMFKVDRPYLVSLPNGKTEWYGEFSNGVPTSIVNTAPVAEMP